MEETDSSSISTYYSGSAASTMSAGLNLRRNGALQDDRENAALMMECAMLKGEGVLDPVLGDVVMCSVQPTKRNTRKRPRRGLDLVAVLDSSGSMNGQAFELLQKALLFLVQQLYDGNDSTKDEGDRLGIVAFNDESQIVLPLTLMNIEGKARANTAINSLRASGGTNLSAGLFQGLDLVKKRKHARPVTSVLLLTDGLSNKGILDSSKLVQGTKTYLKQIGSPTSIFTFGLGGRHDAQDLVEIAKSSSGGVYCYLRNAEEIPGSFKACLGGLMSVIAQNMRLYFDFEIFQPFGISRTQIHDFDKKRRFILLGDIYGSERKEVLFRVRSRSAAVHDIVLNSFFRLEYLDATALRSNSFASKPILPTSTHGKELLLRAVACYNRLLATRAIKRAMTGADGIEDSIRSIQASHAYIHGDKVSQDLIHVMQALQSRRATQYDLLSLTSQFESQRVISYSTSESFGQVSCPGALQSIERSLGSSFVGVKIRRSASESSASKLESSSREALPLFQDIVQQSSTESDEDSVFSEPSKAMSSLLPRAFRRRS